MDSLFGGELTGVARFIVAFIVVLALIGVCAWLVRRFGSGALKATGGRGRQPRLAVVDAATVDTRRRLLLVRRDNVEHLIMIGGPTDVVIEANIVRAAPPQHEPVPLRPAPLPDSAARPAAIDDSAMWPLQPDAEREPIPPRSPAASAERARPQQPNENTVVRSQRRETLAELADALAAACAAAARTARRGTQDSRGKAAGSRAPASGLVRLGCRACRQGAAAGGRVATTTCGRAAHRHFIQRSFRVRPSAGAGADPRAGRSRSQACRHHRCSRRTPRRGLPKRSRSTRISRKRWRVCWAVRQARRDDTQSSASH